MKGKTKLRYMSVSKAMEVVQKVVSVRVGSEIVPLNEAYGRVLAEDVASSIDIPPRDISLFDGYAVRAEDTYNATPSNPVFLLVAGDVCLRAEEVPSLNPRETYYVDTDSFMPTGANAVLPVEVVSKTSGNAIVVRTKVRPGENTMPAGFDVKKGEVIFRRGHMLRAQDVSLLAEIGRWEVKVSKRPVVGILSVGSELTESADEVSPGKKFSGHAVLIHKLTEKAGADPLGLGVAPDDEQAIKKKLEEGLKRADIVATIGGASVGRLDLVPTAINLLTSGNVIIRGMKVQPGRVSSLGVVGGKPIVMLPGHIQSTVLGFYFLLVPLIRLVSDLPTEIPQFAIKAKISKRVTFRKFVPFRRVRFVRIMSTSEGFVAKPILGESVLRSVLVKANGFTIVPKGKAVLEEGEEVSVYLLSGLYPLRQRID
ncbi:MAG: molybdopterin molybdotransferase MoeA [Candidatus Bathyarchaeia archaeon]